MNNTNLQLGMTYEDFVNDDLNNIQINGDISDGGTTADNLIENLTKDPNSIEIPTEYLDQIVLDQDYMEFDNYLSRISQAMVDIVMEYINFTHPEFIKEDDEILVDERFSKGNTGDAITRNVNPKKASKDNNTKKNLEDVLKSTNTPVKDLLTS